MVQQIMMKGESLRLAYAGELLLLEAKESRRGGRTARFVLDPESAPLTDFPKETRFYGVLVRLEDDDTPAEERPIDVAARKLARAELGRRSRIAAILCKDSQFQAFLVSLGWINNGWRRKTKEQMSAQWLCDRCQISSRAELDDSPRAFEMFRSQVEKPFFLWAKEQK